MSREGSHPSEALPETVWWVREVVKRQRCTATRGDARTTRSVNAPPGDI
jgi:hypothetical protein